MSRRPNASLSRPNGSTGGNSVGSIEGRISRCKRYSLSPFPRCGVSGKGIVKQGFPQTMKKGHE